MNRGMFFIIVLIFVASGSYAQTSGSYISAAPQKSQYILISGINDKGIVPTTQIITANPVVLEKSQHLLINGRADQQSGNNPNVSGQNDKDTDKNLSNETPQSLYLLIPSKE
jgi:hypothetical protein